MSENQTAPVNAQNEPVQDGDNEKEQLAKLKERAKRLGVQHSPNIGLKTLEEKIEEFIFDLADKEAERKSQGLDKIAIDDSGMIFHRGAEKDAQIDPKGFKQFSNKELIELTSRQIKKMGLSERDQFLLIKNKQKAEQLALKRVVVTNHDPNKQELEGEIYSVTTKYMPTVRKFIPFGESTQGGYHIPVILLNMLKARKYQQVRQVKDPVTGFMKTTRQLRNEFSFTELPPLTKKELKDLAHQQSLRATASGLIG